MSDNGFLGYVHSFRGFAILNIVAIHAVVVALIVPADWNPDTAAPLYVLNETLFHDSTLYFALISGMLFSSILHARGYQRFYRNKLLYVLSPYVFCTLVFSMVRWNSQGTGVLALPSGWSDYVDSILPNLMHGEAQFTYWYIPVLFFLFAITPLLNRLVRTTGRAAIPVWMVMLSPLAFSRPEFQAGVNQITFGTLIYFTGAYTVGMYLGEDLETRLDYISRYRKPLLAVAASSSVIIAMLQFSQVNRFGHFSLQESLYYVQKLAIAAVVLLWLRDREEAQPRWMSYFANEAFSIYFLHIFFILLLADVFWPYRHSADIQPLGLYLGGPVYLAFALFMSMLVVYLARRLVGRHSRVLIGS
jgi:surface polysaccharide O-acyltransferase-like enzyme